MDTGSRDQRSVGRGHNEDITERLRSIRQKRAAAFAELVLVKVRLEFIAI